MPSRTIQRSLTNGRVETIGNKKTEGHGILLPENKEITNNDTKSSENRKYLKILEPKQYISFD